MIRAEVDAMMGNGLIKLTLADIMLLAEAQSPYIYGGDITADDIELAKRITGHTEMHDADFHTVMLAELDAAFRPLELLEPSKDDGNGKKSRIEPFSPEWMADILRASCQAMPSLTIDQAMHDAPMCLLMHLVLAEARAQGATTRRPPDIKAALEQYKKLKEKD